MAWHLWLRSEPIKDTLAERYLRETLGLTGPLPETLGYCHRAWCPVYNDYTPSLIVPVHDRGEVVAVSQTFLCADTLGPWRTLDGEPVTDTFGRPGAGAVWLGVPDITLGLAASLEDALIASDTFSLPVWAADHMDEAWIPPEVKHLILFANAKQAKIAAVRHTKAGRDISIQPVMRAA